MLAARGALPSAEAEARSASIGASALALPEVMHAAAMLSYVSAVGNEVSTRALIEAGWAAKRRVFTPISGKNRQLLWAEVLGWEDLSPAGFGLLEPCQARAAEPPTDAPVIVPGIAFDRAGNRIGFGAGYYDRFLAKHRGPRIALAYAMQLAEAIPAEPHDVRMDVIVTEHEVIRLPR